MIFQMPTNKKYSIPLFLKNVVSEETFVKWLSRRAKSQVKRDRGKGKECTISQYKNMIYDAVLYSKGKDAYTGEELDWSKISTYDSVKIGRKDLLNMPTVDHEVDSNGNNTFRICSWRTNDFKNDLSISELKAICRLILEKN